MKTFFNALEELNEYFLNQIETENINKGNGKYEAAFMAPECISCNIQKVTCEIQLGRRGDLQNCEWYVFQEDMVSVSIDGPRYDYIKRPFSDFPISTLCKIFSVKGEWGLEVRKFATITI